MVAPPAQIAPQGSATPVFSIRRNADWFAEAGRLGKFRELLRSYVDQLPDGSCFTVHLDGEPVIDKAGAVPVVPASTMKLWTAAVALDMLGPDTIFTTRVRGRLTGGTVTGDLTLIGDGDPLLAVAEYPDTVTYPPRPATPIEVLADAVVASGVSRITGNVVGDGSKFDDEWMVPSWEPEIIRNVEGGPIDALLVNDGRVFDGSARLDTIHADPALGAAEQFLRALRNRGVLIDGTFSVGVADPSTPELAHIDSPPLSTIVTEMMTTSDNNTAEVLLKALGHAVDGVGSREAGLAVVRTKLAEWGVPLEGTVFVDASGLDHGNRVTCNAVVGLLDRQGIEGPLYESLPVAGKSGTLAERFVGTPLAGVLRAKTGTLRIARGLAGFVPTKTGLVSFALVVNVSDESLQDPNAPRAIDVAQPLWDALPFLLPDPPSGPSADQLAP